MGVESPSSLVVARVHLGVARAAMMVAGVLAGASALVGTACGSFTEDVAPGPDAAFEATLPPAEADAAPDVAETGVDATPPATPQAVATVTGAVGGFAAGAGGLAWTVGDEIYSMAPGGAPLAMYASANSLSGNVIVNGTKVFATRDEALITCTVGEPCGSGASAFNLMEPGELSVAGGVLYIAEQGGSRRLLSCPTTGCSAPKAAIDSLPSGHRLLAASVARVAIGFGSGLVIAVAGTGAGTSTTLADTSGLSGLANDGVRAYWLEPVTAKLMAHTLDGLGTATPLATRLGAPRDLVLDGGWLYWLETASGDVRRCSSKTACTDIATVASLPSATRFALGDRVYLLNDANSTIYAAPRP